MNKPDTRKALGKESTLMRPSTTLKHPLRPPLQLKRPAETSLYSPSTRSTPTPPARRSSNRPTGRARDPSVRRHYPTLVVRKVGAATSWWQGAALRASRSRAFESQL